jgi:hypothetical protein
LFCSSIKETLNSREDDGDEGSGRGSDESLRTAEGTDGLRGH